MKKRIYSKETAPKRQHIQDERRRKVLQKQKHGRSEATMSRRTVTQANCCDEEQGVISNICIAEWMISVPGLCPVKSCTMDETEGYCEEDTEEGWLVAARPVGTRYLVEVNETGVAQAKDCYGKTIKSFKTRLPKGSCLECVEISSNEMVVQDILSWKSQCMRNTTFEFRAYWMQARILEAEVDKVTEKNEYVLQTIFYQECTREGLERSYHSADVAYPHNGLIFYHKFGYYQCGLTPLVLVWTDLSLEPSCQDRDGNPIVLQARCSQQDNELIVPKVDFITLEGTALLQVSSQAMLGNGTVDSIQSGDLYYGTYDMVGYSTSSIMGGNFVPISCVFSSNDSAVDDCMSDHSYSMGYRETVTNLRLIGKHLNSFVLPELPPQSTVPFPCRADESASASSVASASASASSSLNVVNGNMTNHRLSLPDSWNKLVFRQLQRLGKGISFQDLLASTE